MNKDKFWYSAYELKPKTFLNRFIRAPQKGFLIRWQSDDFEAGYADCHPWEMFGDDDLDTQILKWRSGEPTLLLKHSLYFAHLDGIARSLKKSLFDSKTKIKSHYTVADLGALTAEHLKEVFGQGFTTLKLKLGANSGDEARLLKKHIAILKSFRLRLDFNSHGYEDFIREVGEHELLSCIEFVEDPCEYLESRWKKLVQVFSIPIYFDQPLKGQSDLSVTFPRVIKPARQSYDLRPGDIITSSMDHAVGQSFAYWYSQQALKDAPQELDFGLQTSHLFESDLFFNQIQSNSCYFKPSEGTGIGFDDVFRKITWMPLC